MTISASTSRPTTYSGHSSTTPPEPSVEIKYKRPDSDAFTAASRPSPAGRIGEKNYINNEVLFQDKNVKISQDFEFAATKKGDVSLISTQIVLETGNRADNIHITKGTEGKLLVTVNAKAYTLQLHARPDLGQFQPLHIKTHGGNDSVVIAPDVTTPLIRIDLGAGNDYAHAGGATTQIRGGAGDDYIVMGSGRGAASGEDGNDLLVAGSGSTALYGGNGNDRMYAVTPLAKGMVHMDGGNGDDTMVARKRHAVMHGGGGNNLMVSHDSAVIYTGRGSNRVRSYHDNTTIYAKPSDNVVSSLNSRRIDVEPSNAGKKAFRVEGSAEFKQNFEDNLELLRMSPTGQGVLQKADELAEQNNAPITLRELSARDDMLYGFNNTSIEQHLEAGGDLDSLTLSQRGFIVDGQPGAKADRGTILYNPLAMYNETSSPITGLAHEMAHAFNGATGTFVPGNTADSANNNTEEPNLERQAVGLQTTSALFDFDGDPNTAPTTTNPPPFTENALKREMGLPLRKRVFENPQT